MQPKRMAPEPSTKRPRNLWQRNWIIFLAVAFFLSCSAVHCETTAEVGAIRIIYGIKRGDIWCTRFYDDRDNPSQFHWARLHFGGLPELDFRKTGLVSLSLPIWLIILILFLRITLREWRRLRTETNDSPDAV
jgi:hypothetical protein